MDLFRVGNLIDASYINIVINLICFIFSSGWDSQMWIIHGRPKKIWFCHSVYKKNMKMQKTIFGKLVRKDNILNDDLFELSCNYVHQSGD